MDLNLYARVFWRFRLLVVAGFLVALALALLSFARVSTSGKITYRQQEKWISYSTLFVTQQGFPWGSSQTAGSAPGGPTPQSASGVPYADPGRFSSLAILYSRLADSDAVRSIMLRQGPINGEIQIAPLLAGNNGNGDALPLISVAAIAPSPQAAVDLANRETAAFRTFLVEQQRVNQIPEKHRVELTVLKRATPPALFAGRSKTPPIVVFVTVMMAILALCFVLENLRPRVRIAGDGAKREAASDAHRLSA